MDHAVSQSNIVCVMIDTSKGSGGYIEAFEDIVIRQAKLDGICTTRDHRTQTVNTNPTNRDLVYVSARSCEYQISRIGCVAVHFRNVTGIKQRCDILQFL